MTYKQQVKKEAKEIRGRVIGELTEGIRDERYHSDLVYVLDVIHELIAQLKDVVKEGQ